MTEPDPVAPLPMARDSLLPEFHPLDERVVRLWRTSNLIVPGTLLLLTLVGGAILGMAVPGARVPVVVGWLLLTALCGWLAFRYPFLAYRASGYRIEERVLLIQGGVWFQRIQLVPLSRLQHVDLQRSPLERRFGLASLVLYTAGAHGAALTIPGLDVGEAVRLRDHLVVVGGDDAV